MQHYATAAAARVARQTYGREAPVELVWRTTDEFRHNRRYVNSVETHAAKDGIIMPRDPNQKGSSPTPSFRLSGPKSPEKKLVKITCSNRETNTPNTEAQPCQSKEPR